MSWMSAPPKKTNTSTLPEDSWGNLAKDFKNMGEFLSKVLAPEYKDFEVQYGQAEKPKSDTDVVLEKNLNPAGFGGPQKVSEELQEKERVEALPDLSLGSAKGDKYEVQPMSNEEWAALTGEQQRAVMANQMLFEARNQPTKLLEVQQYLGMNPDQYGSTTSYATLDDIMAMSKDGPEPKKGGQLTALQQLAAGLYSTNYAASMDAVNPNAAGAPSVDYLSTLPDSLRGLLGRQAGLTDSNRMSLEGLFAPMIAPGATDAINTSQSMASSFSNQFRQTTAGMSLDEVSNYFREYATQAKDAGQAVDVEALMKFYGLEK